MSEHDRQINIARVIRAVVIDATWSEHDPADLGDEEFVYGDGTDAACARGCFLHLAGLHTDLAPKAIAAMLGPVGAEAVTEARRIARGIRGTYHQTRLQRHWCEAILSMARVNLPAEWFAADWQEATP